MPIDYLEYYSGQCFGAIVTNNETVCDEHIGDDIDAELEDHIDDQLFGSSNRRNGKTKSGLAFGNRMYHKLEELFMKLRRLSVRGKRAVKKLAVAIKNEDHEAASKLKKVLKGIKSNMKNVSQKITALWRTRRNKFKQKWAENHKNEHWKSPAAFIAKHGPHNLQVS